MTELHSDDGIAFRSPDDGKVDNVVKTHIHNLTYRCVDFITFRQASQCATVHWCHLV